jgi:hypothetical protein
MFGFFFTVLIAILMIGIGYVISTRTVGHEIAQRNLRRITWLIPLSFVLALGLHSLGKYGWVGLNFMFALFVGFWLLSWNWRKNKAGTLLINAGQLSISKVIVWCGVFEILIAVLKTSSAIHQLSTQLSSTSSIVEVISQVFLYWSLAMYLLASGSSKLELREYGICYMFIFVKWEKLASYKWDEVKPNVLTIHLKPTNFLLSRQFWSLPIPATYRDAVDRILAQHLVTASQLRLG